MLKASNFTMVLRNRPSCACRDFSDVGMFISLDLRPTVSGCVKALEPELDRGRRWRGVEKVVPVLASVLVQFPPLART